MLKHFINKEIRSISLSPKFAGTFLVCSILILLSVYSGIREYRAMKERYHSASQLVNQELDQATSWGSLTTRVYREPDPMSVLVSGVDYDIGRWTPISNKSSIKLKNSAYSDDPIYAVFRFIDFAFIVQYVLTLFALLFTYNAINGEREDGTLKLIFSNSISRTKYLTGKIVGTWLSLVVPVSIPVLLGLLLLMLFNIPLSSNDWLKIIIFMAFSLILFTFFVSLGLLISSLSRKSSTSFLFSLVVWVVLVIVVPRAGIMAAGYMVNVPRVAEIEGQLSGYSQGLWDEFQRSSAERWDEFNQQGDDIQPVSDEILWGILEKEDSLQNKIEKEIHKYDLKLREDLRQRKIQQEKLAYLLSSISPAAAYQIGSMSLAGTDDEIKTRYEDATNNYRNQFYEFVEQKKKETGDLGRIIVSFTMDEEGNQEMSSAGGRNKEKLNTNGLPEFSQPNQTLREAIAPTIKLIGLILVYSIITFWAAAIAFIKYDVR